MEKLISYIDKLRSNIKSNQKDIDNMLDQITRENKDQLIDDNTQDQLYEKGQLADGSFLPDYSPVSVLMKITGDGDKRVKNMTLRDSGGFVNSFDLKIDQTGYTIYATDWKADTLERRYGSNIFGLTDGNLQSQINLLYKPELINQFKSKLENGMSSA